MTYIEQRAPYPEALAEMVAELRYRPGWTFQLLDVHRNDEVSGLTLFITSTAVDAFDFDRDVSITYPFAVPAEVHDRDGWLWWLWERVLDAERHEAMEFFRLGEHQPFAPQHEPVAAGYRASQRSRG